MDRESARTAATGAVLTLDMKPHAPESTLSLETATRSSHGTTG